MLRPGNVHSADGWREVLEPIAARYEGTGVRRYFGADAAFAGWLTAWGKVIIGAVVENFRASAYQELKWEIPGNTFFCRFYRQLSDRT